MENLLRARIRARLNALDINPFEAARRIPAERTFLNDLLIGRKESIRPARLPAVAAALECDPEYLVGRQDQPRRQAAAQTPEISPLAGNSTLPLVGIAEAGTWRPAGKSEAPAALPIPPDPRFPAADQAAYLIRGDHAAWLGAGDGAVVVAVTGAPIRDGDAVIVRRTLLGEDGLMQELSLRRLEAGRLLMAENGNIHRKIDPAGSGIELLARAISAHKVF